MASTRRLAAIMFTDMVGSTASAQTDETEALHRRDEQEAIVRPLFAAHRGREVKSMGDGFLAEFDSALRAVQCAVDIQQHLHERNAQPGVHPIHLRIGVHLGDVEQRETDIFGDAVNIAARIEPLASPGGICISGPVLDQVRNKLPNRFEKLEPTTLKGVQAPVDVYRVVLPWTVRGTTVGVPEPTRLAVLPFANISPDPNDGYFADGLTEEMITVLSELRELRVIARTSVTPYKSTSKGVSEIGAELGVDAVLEGSVRKVGDELRITVQLIDVATQGHTWVRSYDRRLEKVFAVQSEIAKEVAEALKVELRPLEAARLEARPMPHPDSYLAYLKGRALMHVSSREAIDAARAQFELAIRLDDRNIAAHAGLADVTIMRGWWYPDVPYAEWHEAGRRLVARALELDPNLAEAHVSLAMVLWSERDYVGIERELKRALSLNPSYALAHRIYAGVLEDQARAEDALVELTLAEVADPLEVAFAVTHTHLLIWMGKLDEALLRIQKAIEREPGTMWHHVALAHYYLASSGPQRAVEELKRGEDLAREPRAKLLLRALRLALSGEKDQARALLGGLDSSQMTAGGSALGVWAYAELGDIDDCYRWMENGPPTLSLQPIRLDPRLEPVRRDPRFIPFLKRMNLA